MVKTMRVRHQMEEMICHAMEALWLPPSEMLHCEPCNPLTLFAAVSCIQTVQLRTVCE